MSADRSPRPRVGLITFTDGRDSFFDLPRERFLRARHQELAQLLTAQGCDVIDPMAELRTDPDGWFGVRRYDEALACARSLQAGRAECMVLCSHFWTPPMLVIDVVRELAVARRALEQRFVRLVGRTPASEIRRVRLEEAKQMLVETDQSIAHISRATGFGHQDLFSRVFRRSVGLTPSQFRSQHKHA